MGLAKLLNLMDKPWKIAIDLILASSIYFGTCHSTNGFAPLYTEIRPNHTAYGIVASLIVDVKPGAKVYGAVLSLGSNNSGTINGAKIDFWSNHSVNSITNGLDVGFIYNGTTTNGEGEEFTVNGLQFAVLGCFAPKGKVVQIGLMDKANDHWSLILNPSFGSQDKILIGKGEGQTIP
jgi:hypothetical protein